MRQCLYNGTVSVRPSVCPVYRPLRAATAGLLLRARDIDRLLSGAQQQGGAQQHMRAVPRCRLRYRKLNTD